MPRTGLSKEEILQKSIELANQKGLGYLSVTWTACSAWAACAPLTAGPAASISAKAKLTNRFQTECFISAAFLSGRVAFAWFVYAVCPAYALMVPESVCSIWSESVLGA